MDICRKEKNKGKDQTAVNGLVQITLFMTILSITVKKNGVIQFF